MRRIEKLAIKSFQFPEGGRSTKKREAYLAYLGEAHRTTCGPDIWPPLSWPEFLECHSNKGSIG